jgi:hypothetical protein
LEERDIYRKTKEQKYWYEAKKLEALDLAITKGMLEVEDQCRIHHCQPWTREVNKVMTTANILRIKLYTLKNNIDCTKQIAQKQALLKKVIVLTEDIKETTTALRVAQKNCRTLIKEQRTQKTSIDEEQEAAFVAMNPEIDAIRANIQKSKRYKTNDVGTTIENELSWRSIIGTCATTKRRNITGILCYNGWTNH